MTIQQHLSAHCAARWLLATSKDQQRARLQKLFAHCGVNLHTVRKAEKDLR